MLVIPVEVGPEHVASRVARAGTSEGPGLAAYDEVLAFGCDGYCWQRERALRAVPGELCDCGPSMAQW
jgi:hypothetical protein